MATPNTQKLDIETSSSGADDERQNMLELLDDIAEEKVGNLQGNEAILLQTLKTNPGKVYSEIRGAMSQKLLKKPSQFENFTKSDIYNTNTLSDATIREKLELLLINVKSGQDRLKKRAESFFAPETFADTPAGNENRKMLDKWISKQGERDIEKYLKSPAFLRRKLGRECFGDDRMMTFVSRLSLIGLEQLGISVNELNKDEKMAVNAIFSGDINSDRGDIQTYLKIIDKSRKPDSIKLGLKKDLLRTALPTVSPRFLVENEVITEAEGKEKVKMGLEAILGDDYFITGTPQEKADKERYLDYVYEKSEYIEVPIDDYLGDNTFLESVFRKGASGATEFTKRLEETLKDMRTEITLAEFDFDGLKIEPDLENNWHRSFVKNLSNLKRSGGASKIANAETLGVGSYIRYVQNFDGGKRYSYIKITSIDKEFMMPAEGLRDKEGIPVKHRGIIFEDWGTGEVDGMLTPEKHKDTEEMKYVELWSILKDPNTDVEILSENDVARRRKTPEELRASGGDKLEDWETPIPTKYSEDDEFGSIKKLSDALGWEPKIGGVYTTNEMQGGSDFFLEIRDISEDKGKITINDGVEDFTLSFRTFHNAAKDIKLEEQGKYTDPQDITHLLQQIDGFKDIHMKDGVLVEIKKGEDGKEIVSPVNHFLNEDGEGMYFSGISREGVTVSFGDYPKGKDGNGWTDNKGKVNLTPFKGYTMRLSIVGLLNYLRSNDYKPYVNPKDKPVVDHEKHMPHSHGSTWGKFLNRMSFSDVKKSFGLYKHAWEHKLEKNSKFQSANFASKYLRNLMPEGFSYQLRSEAYGAQNEAMEGILKMLENEMSGKEARLYVRKKILLNDDAKFEEILAGLLYIAKKSGQLYPEELSDLKNSNLWFYKLAITQGYKTKEERQWLRQKCIDSSDKGAADVSAINEIDLIERQLKYYEGKEHRLPPNIAPRFPGAIREGEEESKKKGQTEIEQRSNIKQMNKYALSKGNVGEWYKVIGAMDRIHGKNGSPVELNALPFLMVYSNAPEYMGSNYRRMLHSYGTGKRASNAFRFGNEMHLVNTYRGMVQLAAQEVARRTNNKRIVDELNKIELERSKVGNENHDEDHENVQKKWINSIYNFWMKYGDKLQPILQMTDTYIDAEAQFGTNNANKSLCEAYKKRYEETTGMQNKQLVDSKEIYKTDNVTEGNMAVNHTPFGFTTLVNAAFSAIYQQNGTMGQGLTTAYADIFKTGVLGYLYKLRNLTERDIPPGMDLDAVRKARFEEYFAALMYYFRTKGTNPPEIMLGGYKDGRNYSKLRYMRELEAYGFDFKVEDWGVRSQTIPNGAEVDEKTETPNKLIIDSGYDRRRCDEMYQNFIRTTGHVQHIVSKGVRDAVYEGHGA